MVTTLTISQTLLLYSNYQSEFFKDQILDKFIIIDYDVVIVRD
jgi:hypothetical protein